MKLAIAHSNTDLVQALKKALRSFYTDIVWVVGTRDEMIYHCMKNKPDILLLDLEIEGNQRTESIAHIMKAAPCAILLLTPHSNYQQNIVFEALGLGALDAIKTPLLNDKKELIDPESLFKKIYEIANLLGKRTVFHDRNPHPSSSEISQESFAKRNSSRFQPRVPAVKENKQKEPIKKEPAQSAKIKKVESLPPLLLLGASTGGPMALLSILSNLPKPSSIATIIIQHIDEKFAPQLVRWLQTKTDQPVKLIESKMKPQPGEVFVAGTNQHVILNENLEFVYTEEPLKNTYRPSIDVFFSSVAKHWPLRSVAVLLTGIGSDGAKGLKDLYEAGWYTIAQHEKGCVIYGMPKAAIELKGVSEVFKIEEIASAITSHIHKLRDKKHDN